MSSSAAFPGLHRHPARLAGAGACGALALLTAATVSAQPAAVDARAPQGLYRVETVADAAADAAPGSFRVHLSERRPWGLTAVAQGPCAESMRVEIRFIETPQNRLDAYASSRAGRDLPVAEPMAALRPVLVQRCPELQVLRVRFESALTANKYGYEGTMQRAEGWALRDGAVATAHDRSALVALKSTDFFQRVHLQHAGRCEDAPTLLLEPMKPRAFDSEVSLITNYTAMAETVAAQYAQQCRAVQRLRFALGRMPAEFRCKDAGDCFLEAAWQEGRWQVSLAQLATRERYSPIHSFEDMAEVLAAGRFDVLTGYDSYFSFFVAALFEAWSEECRATLRDPVGRVIRWTETKRDGSTEHSESQPIFVERSRAWAYDRHHDGAMGFMLNTLMSQPRSGGFEAGVRTGATVGQRVLASRAAMKRLVSGHCTSERLDAVWQNLLARAAAQPAVVTDRYGTSKRPAESFDADAASAPAFAEALRRERAQGALDAAAARAQAERQPLAPVPAATAAGRAAAELQHLHQQAMEKLDQDHRAQLQQASNPFTRLKLEAEFRLKRAQLEREHRERLRQAPR